jgi:hypothetical protein
MKKAILTLAIICLVAFMNISLAAIPLKLNLQKEKTYTIKSVSLQTMTMSFNGMQINMDMTNSSTTSFTPLLFEENYCLITVKLDSISTEITSPQGSIKMNSNKPGNPKNQMEIGSVIFNKLCKSSLIVKMSYTGKIIEITNIASITDSINQLLDSIPSATRMQIKPTIDGIIGASALKSTIEVLTSYLPENAIEIGDKWESKSNLTPNGMNLNVTTKFKLKELNVNQALIMGDATIESIPDGTMNMNGMKIPYNLRGMNSSEQTIDINSGWIIKGTTKSRLQGTMEINGNETPIEISGKTEIISIQ